jgi:hypothetical protein
MPAPAANFTLHGLQTLLWAIADAEAGLVVQTLTNARKSDSKEVRGITGDFVAVGAGYGRKGDLRISGYSTGGVTSALGATLTVANTLTGNALTNALTILNSVTDNMNNTDFIRQDIGGAVYDFGTGAT